MKKIFLLMFLCASAVFAELSVVETKQEGRNGLFVGGGIGVGANALKIYNLPLNLTNLSLDPNQSFASFVFSAKVGGYHYFTEALGLRYYYNLDINTTPFGELLHPVFGVFDIYGISFAHTVNIDAFYTVFSKEKWSVDVIGGIGMGAITGEVNAKQDGLIYPLLLGDSSSKQYVNFDFRFNLGARVMFDRKYGIELMAKLPVVESNILKELKSSLPITAKQSPFYFTIDFVVEKF